MAGIAVRRLVALACIGAAALALLAACTPDAGAALEQAGSLTSTPVPESGGDSDNRSPGGIVPIADGAAVLHYVQAGETFVLDGSRSQDDGAIRDYNWRQVSGPFAFSTRDGSRLAFTPSLPGTYVFELVATDGQGHDSVVSRQVVVAQTDPGSSLDAALHYAKVGESFSLDGNRSKDAETSLSFRWRQVSGPYAFSTRDGDLLELIPMSAGTYVFELVATDGQGQDGVVGRHAVLVQAEPAASPDEDVLPLTCAMAVLPEGVEFDSASFDRDNNVNWDFCGGGSLRSAGEGAGDGEATETLRAIRKPGAHKFDYAPAANFKIEIDGVIQGGSSGASVTGIYSEKASISPPQGGGDGTGADASAGNVSGPGDPHYGSITIRRAQVNDQSLYEWYKKMLSGTTDRKSGSIIYLDREGNESLRVVLDECTPTGYRPFIIDGLVREPSEEITVSCAISGVRGTGAEAELYRWLHESLQGRAQPRTVVVWEVLADGSVGRTFVYEGAFPKEWTLPSMDASRAGNPLYEEGGSSGTNPLYEGRGQLDSHLIEEIEFVVEKLEKA